MVATDVRTIIQVQLCLRWCSHNVVIAIPPSSSPITFYWRSKRFGLAVSQSMCSFVCACFVRWPPLFWLGSALNEWNDAKNIVDMQCSGVRAMHDGRTFCLRVTESEFSMRLLLDWGQAQPTKPHAFEFATSIMWRWRSVVAALRAEKELKKKNAHRLHSDESKNFSSQQDIRGDTISTEIQVILVAWL